MVEGLILSTSLLVTSLPSTKKIGSGVFPAVLTTNRLAPSPETWAGWVDCTGCAGRTDCSGWVVLTGCAERTGCSGIVAFAGCGGWAIILPYFFSNAAF